MLRQCQHNFEHMYPYNNAAYVFPPVLIQYTRTLLLYSNLFTVNSF